MSILLVSQALAIILNYSLIHCQQITAIIFVILEACMIKDKHFFYDVIVTVDGLCYIFYADGAYELNHFQL